MEKRKFLVVVDPSHDRHLALERMLDVCRQRGEWVSDFHLLIGHEGVDKSDPNSPDEVTQSKAWFDDLLGPVDELGIEYTTEFCWTTNWRKSIADAAERYECDTIMISESSAEHKRGITDSKWELVRQARCDVVIVDEGTRAPIKTILAAVNTQTEDAGHIALNERILARGQFLAEYFGAAYHVVNAYTDSENFPDRQELSRLSGLPRENIHRDMGKPEDVIVATAEKYNADMVLIGISPRSGIAAKFANHTTEKVMEKITVDVVAID